MSALAKNHAAHQSEQEVSNQLQEIEKAITVIKERQQAHAQRIASEQQLVKYGNRRAITRQDYPQIELLAEQGLGEYDVAESLGVTGTTWTNTKKYDQKEYGGDWEICGILGAYKRGRAKWKQETATTINIQAKHNPIVNIFRAKNALGWNDNQQQSQAPMSVHITIGGGISDAK